MYQGNSHIGELRDSYLVPLEGLTELGAAASIEVLAAAGRNDAAAVPITDVRFRPLVPNPSKVFCIGLNYRDHIAESQRELPTYPVMIAKFASSLIGAHDDIVLPPESTAVDYEGEMAIVIGRRGRRIAETDALNYVLGYTVANDVTMRDYQYKTHQWMQGKVWEASTPVGPFVVTPGEVNIDHAGIRTVLNGEKVQESDLSQLIFTTPKLIARLSTLATLLPGDLILTGTPGGVGYRRDPPRLLAEGDRVSVQVDGVGTIENLVCR
jgi:acylpyruvate hydrolase